MRETEAEAPAELRGIVAKANPEAVKAFGYEVKTASKASPEGEEDGANSTFADLTRCTIPCAGHA